MNTHCAMMLASCTIILVAGAVAAAQPPEAGGGNPFRLSADHATASVADIETESRWYRDVLGFKQVKDVTVEPGFRVRQMAIQGYRIDLVWRKGSARGSLAKGDLQQGWLHVVFRTPDVDAAYRALSKRGEKLTVFRDKQSRIQHFSIFDPEGNEIGIGA